MGLVNMNLSVTAEEAARLSEKLLAGETDPLSKLHDTTTTVGVLLQTASTNRGETTVSEATYESGAAQRERLANEAAKASPIPEA